VSGAPEKEEAWRRLVKGLRPTGFDPRALFRASPWRGPALDSREGRVDLTGLSLPDPFERPVAVVGGAVVSRLGGLVELRDVLLKDVDLSEARLPSLRLFDCVLENCVFRRAVCEDWRIWRTTVRRCSFEEADLRESALGGLGKNGRWRERNRFLSVSFDRADLRGTAWHSSEVSDCSFRETQLQKVEFNGTVFQRCVFSGPLEEVVFARHAYGGERLPPNEMRDVDFTGASFHWVAFHELDLATVRLPDRSDHLVVDDYPARLDRLLRMVEGRADLPSRQLHAVFARARKRVGAAQRRGVVNLNELRELAGSDLLEPALRILRD
jgi:uncharacterized protein YjbI with pentapeptide repeats